MSADHPDWSAWMQAAAAAGAALSLAAPAPCGAAPGEVLAQQKISDTAGGFSGSLHDNDFFGRSVALLGDLDGDGVADVAVGASGDNNGEIVDTERGAVWVLFLNDDGTVKGHQKISGADGGFGGVLDNGDRFGRAVSAVGDLDGDGVPDLAVGADQDDDGGVNRGAVWVLLLNDDGTVKADQKISDTAGGFTGALDDGDQFGQAVAPVGDLDGDHVADLVVGAASDDDGGNARGAVWVLFLNDDGTVKGHQKISGTAGGFTGALDDNDQFGSSTAALGDLDRDGVCDVAVGAIFDDDGGGGALAEHGAVYVLFLNGDGTVKSHTKISDTAGGFSGILDDADQFGYAAASPGDLDGDLVADLAVGAFNDDDGGILTGAVWMLFLNGDGTVKSHQKISDTDGGFTGAIDPVDHFGASLAGVGDLDGDGIIDLAAGATGDDDGGPGRGALWVVFLDGVPPCPGDADGDRDADVNDLLDLLSAWGTDPCGPPDFNGDGNVNVTDLLVLLGGWGVCE